MSKSISFRDLLAVAVVKSRHDCEKELHILQGRISSLEAALRDCNEERKRILDTNEEGQPYADVALTAMRSADIASDLIVDLQSKNIALRQELDKQPVGSESINFRRLALETPAEVIVSGNTGSSDSTKSPSQYKETQGLARPESLVQSMSVLHYRYYMCTLYLQSL